MHASFRCSLRQIQTLVLALVVCQFFAAVGCQSLLTGKASQSVVPPVAGADTSTYTLEVHSNWTKPKNNKVVHTGPVPLQTVIESTGMASRYRDLEITVVRVAKESGQILRLDADFDPTSRAIKPQYDYDVLPNDHIIIKPGNTSAIDDLIKPLNQLTGGGGV